MTTTESVHSRRPALGLLTGVVVATLALAAVPASWAGVAEAPQAAQKPAAAKPVPAKPAQGTLFASPEEARDALVAAGTAKDRVALEAIFGPDYAKLRSSDAVQQERHSERFAMHLKEAATLVKVAEGKYTVSIGERRFPFPIPIVKDGDKWRFDTDAGLDEILTRRIGDDELSAIMTCRAYVLAQWEYLMESGNHNEDGLAEYAEKFISTPGKRDGLYWETGPDEDPSPLGLLVAQARAEGYGRSSANAEAAHVQTAKAAAGTAGSGKPAAEEHHAPFHGYYFKILMRQGASAPGGAFSYLVNGHMLAGFALVAYPAEWGNSGVVTFIVNTQGRVYERNLGPKTAELVLAMKEYNPDTAWKLVPKY
ncbi:MAG TPA: DUF2950 domain-containing protein [Candidatus Acidoferrales bacterium]|nr:DUF2950 domain-containing protein [Candidatus Acidoferrales bacterium]